MNGKPTHMGLGAWPVITLAMAAGRDYVLPKISHTRLNDITTADVMGVLVPHWTSKHETMRRVKQRVSAVMRWSMAQGYRQDDPAGDALNVALPKRGQPRQHLRALRPPPRNLLHLPSRNFEARFLQTSQTV